MCILVQSRKIILIWWKKMLRCSIFYDHWWTTSFLLFPIIQRDGTVWPWHRCQCSLQSSATFLPLPLSKLYNAMLNICMTFCTRMWWVNLQRVSVDPYITYIIHICSSNYKSCARIWRRQSPIQTNHLNSSLSIQTNHRSALLCPDSPLVDTAHFLLFPAASVQWRVKQAASHFKVKNSNVFQWILIAAVLGLNSENWVDALHTAAEKCWNATVFKSVNHFRN